MDQYPAGSVLITQNDLGTIRAAARQLFFDIDDWENDKDEMNRLWNEYKGDWDTAASIIVDQYDNIINWLNTNGVSSGGSVSDNTIRNYMNTIANGSTRLWFNQVFKTDDVIGGTADAKLNALFKAKIQAEYPHVKEVTQAEYADDNILELIPHMQDRIRMG